MKCSSQTKEKIEIMMREARIMRGFNHKNIIHCYGVAAEIEPVENLNIFKKLKNFSCT